MSEMLQAALAHAAKGRPVFPCDPATKKPLTEHGFKDAVTDPALITKWWTKWPDAMIGMPTGKVSGVFAVDLDGQVGLANWAALAEEWDWLDSVPDTAKQTTPGAGEHLLFQWPGTKVRCSTSKIAPKIDVRGDGGYIIIWPSRRADGREYKLVNGCQPAKAPCWLLDLVTGQAKTEKKTLAVPAERPGTSPYGLGAMEREVGRVATAPQGQRNDALNTASFALGQLVAGGEVDEGTALGALQRAAKAAGLPQGEAEKTIMSGFTAGQKEPRSAAVTEFTFMGKDDKKPCQLASAREVVAQLGAENILHDGRAFWRWDGTGVWRRIDDRVVKQAALDVLTRSGKVTRSAVDSITDLVKTMVFSDKMMEPTKEFINCLSGELHWAGAGWELRPHRKEHLAISQAPVAWEGAKAKCPRFERFLGEVFAGDADAREKRLLLLEMMGYTMLPTARYEKFIVLIGSGANGKSVVLSTLQALLGHENVASVAPDQFNNRFQRAFLLGKLANVISELPEGAVLADAELKAIVSGESITAEFKHQAAFNFRPSCTIWCGTNHLPSTRDFSDALFRRALVLRFNRKFEEHEQDKMLTDKLKEELPGILHLALEAFGRVLRQGEFTTPASVHQARQEWRLDSDQVAAFIDDAVERVVGEKISSQTVYGAYRSWACDAGITRMVGRKAFTQRLERLGFQTGRGTGGIRTIWGLRLRGAEEL